MQVEIRHSPSYSTARVSLGPNESITAESGSMALMSSGVTLESSTKGGLKGALKRGFLSGESFFVTTFTAGSEGGFLDLAPALSGDIFQTCVGPQNGGSIFVSRGAWLASESGVTLDSKWGGFKNLLGGEGGFLSRASGEGQILLSSYGAIEEHDLSETGPLTVDTGHMVAYDEEVTVNLRKAANGVMSTLKSGEGLVFEFSGAGKVWTQSRNPSSLVAWIAQQMPSK